MKKRCVALIVFLAVFMNACETQRGSTPEADSPTRPSPRPYVYAGDTAPALAQSDTHQGPSSNTPTLFASNTPFASPTKEFVETPTFSPTLTPIPTLKPDQAGALVNIHMMVESSGWGIGENGHIVHTKDGGTTWNDVTPPQGAYNEDGFFAIDAQIAWATPYCLGHQFGGDNHYFCEKEINQTNVWGTHDGGNTWFASLPVCINSGCNNPISSEGDGSLLPESIRFVDSQHGWLAISRGSSMFQDRYNGFYTNDGGRNWNFLMSAWTNGIISGPIAALEPLDEESIFLFTNQAHGAYDPRHDLEYSQSDDGGKTWRDEHTNFPIPNTRPFVDPTTPSPFTDYPRCGTIESQAIPPLVLDLTQECHYYNEANQIVYYFTHLHSEDGSKTWNYWQQTGDVDFINAKTGWEMVLTSDKSHEIQQTHDGGLTWSTIKTVEWDGILDFVNDQVGYALAYNQGIMAVMFTTDGGKTWKLRSQAPLTRIPCLISTWNVCNW
jgi:photosystem II stability/assembly factor-like uncharacterized protein